MTLPEALSLEQIKKTRDRIMGLAVRTPLIPFDQSGSDFDIYLKPEILQPIGSFKIRGAAGSIGMISDEVLAKGVYTASAGNMAQGVAWIAREMGIACAVIVPEHAPKAKLAAIERLGAHIRKVTFEAWWQILVAGGHPDYEGHFVHPVSDPLVMAGNGSIGLEIYEDLPQVHTVLVPFGGGGLSCGIASALKELQPSAKIVACEVATAAPLTASRAAGKIQTIDYVPSFVDGIGAATVLKEMWPLTQKLIEDTTVVSLEQVVEAVRILAEQTHVVVEGAGAVSLAAALHHYQGKGPVVCILSGGSIDPGKLAIIFEGRIP